MSRLQELQATLAPAEAKLKAARTATSVAEDHRREIQVAISAAQADLHRLEGEAAASRHDNEIMNYLNSIMASSK